MQQGRTNVDRTAATRAALLEAARKLFVEKGYAGTGTPEIVAAARVTRGALYHHFEDKRALFQAVIEAEAAAVAAEIDAATPASLGPLEALERGTAAYLDAMGRPGRTRLLLIEAPAVLPTEVLQSIDAANGGRTLAEGLAAAMPARKSGEIEPIAALLGAAFDRAALAVVQGEDRTRYEGALLHLLHRLVA